MILPELEHARFGRLSNVKRSLDRKGLELRILEQYLDCTEWCKFMALDLAKNDRPARSKPATPEEFWVTFALWLLNQVIHSKRGSNLPLDEVNDVKTKLKSDLTKDRRKVLHASMSFSSEGVMAITDHHRSKVAEMVKAGSLLCVDETILSSDSKVGAQRGCLKYIPEKPHPKGFFAHCAVQKLLRSQSVIVLDVESKWNFHCPSMGDAAWNLIKQCETSFKCEFVVLLDSGYPASRFLCEPQTAIKSKFICSISVSKVSGKLRGLAEVAKHFLRKSECIVVYSPMLDLVATLHGKQQYTSVLVTNYFVPSSKHVEDSFPLKMGIRDARELAKFSHPIFLQIADAFAPQLSSDTNCLSNQRHHILQLTGADIGSPIDQDGFVTSASLKSLNIEDLRDVAQMSGVQSTKGGKPKAKETLVKEILAVHPQAIHEQSSDGTKRKGKRPSSLTSSEEQLIQQNRVLSKLKARLLTRRAVPKYAELYAKNYGDEDRFNYLLYECFRHQLARSPEQHYTWLLLYIYVVNAWTIFKETLLEHAVSENHTPHADARISLEAFCWNLVSQIADVYR